MVFQQRVVHLVLLGVSVFSIADGALDTLYVRVYSLGALATGTDRPLNRLAFANFGFPVSADLAEVIGEDESGAGAICAVYHCNVVIGQFYTLVFGCDLGVAPFGYFSQINLRQSVPSQLQLAGFDTINVNHGHYAPHYSGELRQVVFAQFIGRKGGVSCTKIHGLGFYLFDAATRTDRLVIQAHIGFSLVGLGPFCIDRVRESRARSGEVSRVCRTCCQK